MAATSASSFFPCVSPLNSSANDSHEPFKGLLCPHYCKPFASWKPTPALKCTRSPLQKHSTLFGVFTIIFLVLFRVLFNFLSFFFSYLNFFSFISLFPFLSRLSSAHITAVAPKRAYRSLTVSGLVDDGSGTNTEEELSNSSAVLLFYFCNFSLILENLLFSLIFLE